MATLFYRQRRFFALAVLMIVALGAATLSTIGRQEDPTITNLFATIVTPYPGADPARVEALVTDKIEAELEPIAEIIEIGSDSRTGISVVRVELSSFISETEIAQVWSEIRDALADAADRFPPDVSEPTFDNDRTGAYTAIVAVLPRAGVDASPALVARHAEHLQKQLRSLPGSELVRLYGEPDEEILVTLDGDHLAALGLTVDQVSMAVARADAKVQAGRVRGPRTDLVIEVAGEIKQLDRVRAIPVITGTDGPVLRVGDIATVRRTVRTPVATKAFVDGERAVVVAARMQADLQVDVWMASVRRVLDEFRAGLPGGLEARLLFDQSTYTTDRLWELSGNLMLGVGLVLTVLAVTLGPRAAAIVGVILPLTALVSLVVLEKLGVPIHQMSVTGLIVALGLLVDAAIVMTDEIRKRLVGGMATEEAVGQSVRRLTVPLLASTVTTVLAFLPMALLPGPAGDFVGSIATAVIVMLIASLVLALTITPALAGFLLPGGAAGNGVPAGWFGQSFAWSLDVALRHRRLAVLAALVLPVIGFSAFPTLTAQFFPGVDRDQFYVQVHLAEGASLANTEAAMLAADAILRAEPAIDRVHWFLGESAPAFYYNMQMTQDGVAGFAEALVTTASADVTATVIPVLQDRFDTTLPEAQVIVRGLVQGPPVEAPVELRLVGPDLGVLRDLGDAVRAEVAALPAVVHTRATLAGGAPKLVFELDEDAVRLAGLRLADVARQLDSLLEGATGGSLVEGSEELPVRVRIGDDRRAAAGRIATLTIMPPNARVRAVAGGYPGIPLSGLGRLTLVPSDSAISRLNGERINTVQAFLQPDVLPEEVLDQVLARLDASGFALPPGTRLETGGDSDAREETEGNLMSSMGLIVAAMIATIVISFNSFRLSLVALAVSVLSTGLSLLALAVFDYPFGIQALIGVIGSIGVSINAAIIILTALQRDERAARGEAAAIRDVVVDAGRHIVSTTVTTFGGFLPLILAGGGFWPPFAMAIAGGVLLSTVVSFYFVPPMFSLLLGKRVSQGVTTDPAMPFHRPTLEAA